MSEEQEAELVELARKAIKAQMAGDHVSSLGYLELLADRIQAMKKKLVSVH